MRLVIYQRTGLTFRSQGKVGKERHHLTVIGATSGDTGSAVTYASIKLYQMAQESNIGQGNLWLARQARYLGLHTVS